MAAVRSASATWRGDLFSGNGTVSANSSGLFENLPVSWAARTEQPDGLTSPEELHTSAQVTFDKRDGGWAVTSSALQVLGRVPNCSPEAFQAAAEAARDGCPVSKALAGNVTLSGDATLEQ
jgi:osmotically inducible protein OsmC